jgi:hypothetical protein
VWRKTTPLAGHLRQIAEVLRDLKPAPARPEQAEGAPASSAGGA